MEAATDRQVEASRTAGSLARTSWLGVLGWAAYLACSWTWCIGMFLPVLLVRDYGIWGFVVFGVPNVVGAGAMGWVLRDGASERLVKQHESAMVWFMRITLMFQWFFVGWLARSVGLWWIGLPLFLGGLAFSRRPTSPISILVWCVSVLCGVAFLLHHPVVVVEQWSLWNGNFGVVWLAPVCGFGFALCPYLDITFHKARRSLDETGSRASFSLGFGVLFAAMIGFTLLYAPLMLGGPTGLSLGSIAGAAVCVHICLQIMYTTGAFYDAFGSRTPSRTENLRGFDFMALMLICHMIGLFGNSAGIAGMSLGEIVYRCFMSFYGLVFPAYVWLCMIPTRDGHSGVDGALGRRKLVVLLGACVLAAPCYWMGFIERVEWWLAPGLGVVLVARLLVRGRDSATSPAPELYAPLTSIAGARKNP